MDVSTQTEGDGSGGVESLETGVQTDGIQSFNVSTQTDNSSEHGAEGSSGMNEERDQAR